MPDPVSRSAARLAALIALPVALIAGVAVFALLGDALRKPAAPPPATSPAAPAPTGPVEVAARSLTEREEIVCWALLSQLPDTIDGLAQRPVTAGAEQNAAYGEPPITVTCAVPPAEYGLTDVVWPMNGVCWYAAEEPDRTVWTTLDREVPVQVAVPAAYDEPGQWVAGLSPTVVSTVRSATDIPTGCR